jgi:hypothetical protein
MTYKIEPLKELSGWDFRDTISIPDGYDMQDIPDLTRDNFNKLVEEHNKLVAAVNTILDATLLIKQ